MDRRSQKLRNVKLRNDEEKEKKNFESTVD